jgi:hypothetical protein
MQYAQDFSYNENEIPYDDIDILFSQLETIETPPSIVAHILEQVKAQTIGVKNPFSTSDVATPGKQC